jgi:ADP-heptose:LPS heptosyltransferase
MLRRNVLIFHLGGLGDFVLTWPFAIAMGRIYPQSRIIYVTHRQKGLLAERVLRLESRDVEAGWHGLFAEGGKLPQPTQSLLESAHTVYTFLPVTETWHRNIETLNPACKRVVIDPRPAETFAGHVTEWMVQSLGDLKVERSATQQILRSIGERGTGFKVPGGTDIVIHPGSGSVAKCWPIERWIDLAGKLQSADHRVRFLIGEVERDRWTSAEFDRLKSVGDVRNCETNIELLNQLSTAAVFIGNDSGPGHLAAMIGVPTVSLFGPTDSNRWRPIGPQVKVLQLFETITSDHVLSAIQAVGRK